MSGHKVCWGKILVGAAIAAGAVAAFAVAAPYLQDTVVPVIKSLATQAGEAIATAWSWVGQHIIGGFDSAALKVADAAQSQAEALKTLAGSGYEVAKEAIVQSEQAALAATQAAAQSAHGIAGFIVNNKAISIATAAGAGALLAASSKSHHYVPQMSAAEQSFAMREQMRASDALMAARMAATGYNPGNGRGRG
jgi:hypothetical protein